MTLLNGQVHTQQNIHKSAQNRTIIENISLYDIKGEYGKPSLQQELDPSSSWRQ